MSHPPGPRPTRLALGSALLAAAAGLTLAPTAGAASSPVPGGSPSSFTMTPKRGNGKAVKELQGRLPAASVASVLASANRTTRGLPGNAPQRDAYGFQAGFRFDAGDTSTTKWYPQGISGSGDATGGLYDGRRSLLVSWYAPRSSSDTTTVKPGVRVSFVTAEQLSGATYRHVLLVDPYRRKNGTADFRWTRSHAGGIAWVGNRLYVAETTSGLSVYDVSKMLRVSATSGNKTKVGCTPAPCEAADYQYVMPKVASYGDRSGDLRFSSVSYDRTTNSLLTSEYRKAGEGSTRIVRWGLKANGALQAQATPQGRRVVSDGVWSTGVRKVQGSVARGSSLWLSTSGDSATRGLWTGALGGTVTRRAWPAWAEDLTYAPGSGRLYSLTEHEGDRAVFAVGG